MKMSNLPQQITINQYTADGATTIFNYTYLLPLSTDVQVYLTEPGEQPVLQVLTTNYTVQNVGTENGGTITFLVAPLNGYIVTFIRNIQASIDTEYNEARNINGQNLDDDFGRITLVSQQYISNFNNFGLQYSAGTIPSPFIAGSNIIPRLADNQVWVGQNGGVIAATLEQNPDTSLLRSQLANQGAGTAGSTLVGYYNITTMNGMTVSAFLDSLASKAVSTAGATLIGYYDIGNAVGTTVTAFLNQLASAVNALPLAGVAKAWAYIHVTGGVATINKSFNVTSVSYGGTGDTSIHLTTPTIDAEGATVYGMNAAGYAIVQDQSPSVLRTTTFNTSNALTDLDYYVAIFD